MSTPFCQPNTRVADARGCRCPHYGDPLTEHDGTHRCKPHNPRNPDTVVLDGCSAPTVLVADARGFRCAVPHSVTTASSSYGAP